MGQGLALRQVLLARPQLCKKHPGKHSTVHTGGGGNGGQRSTYRIRRFGAGSDSRAGGKVEKEKRKVRRHVSISYLRGISKAAIRAPTYG